MNLYRVDIERTMFVVAESESEAAIIAEEFERDQVAECAPELTFAQEVTDEADIPDAWRNSLPWGGDDDRTCEWYVRNRAVEPFVDTKTTDMFAEPMP